jgi:hypothetical protein
MKSKNRFAQLVCWLVILFAPAAALACFQIGGSPSVLQNKDVKVRFTFDGKPLSNAPVSLWNHKKGTIAKSETASNGWCVFKGIPVGEYKLMLHGPSNESFRIELQRSETDKTAMKVNFVDEWCSQMAIIQDRS